YGFYCFLVQTVSWRTNDAHDFYRSVFADQRLEGYDAFESRLPCIFGISRIGPKDRDRHGDAASARTCETRIAAADARSVSRTGAGSITGPIAMSLSIANASARTSAGRRWTEDALNITDWQLAELLKTCQLRCDDRWLGD